MTKISSKLVFPLALVTSGGLFAVEPNPVRFGNFDLVPLLSLDVLNNDNIFRAENNEVDSFITVLSPQLNAIAIDGLNLYNVEVQGFKGVYSDSSDDDFTDWRVGANAHIELSSRNIVDFVIGFYDNHEERGDGRSQFLEVPSSPDEFEEFNYGLSYQYGSDNSRGRLVFDVNGYNKEYQNNQTFTDIFSYDSLNLGATFFLNVLPRTDILFEVGASSFDYDDNTNPLIGLPGSFSSDEIGGYVGVAWEASANTTGTVKVGRAKKDFDDDFRTDANNPVYEAGIEWTPLTYTIFNFDVTRSFEEGYGFGDAREQTQFSVAWEHSWSNRVNSQLSFSQVNIDYIGADLEDDVSLFSAGVSYAFARWLDFRLEVYSDTRDSSRGVFDHNQHVISIGFDASL